MAKARILFVCLGNICRSPTVEGVVRAIAAREAPELDLEVDSAGTGDYHIGAAPDPRTLAAAKTRGYDLTNLRARQVTAADFERFDLLLAMDEQNFANLQRLAPRAHAHKVGLFLDYARATGRPDVPDPYFGEAGHFDEVLDLAESGARGLIAALRQDASGRRA